MTLFEELKSATKISHDQLEKELDLLSPDVTLTDYKRILERFWGVYLPVENHIRNSELKNMYEGRWKSDLLKDDLLKLGSAKKEIDELPLCEVFQRPMSLSEILGTLYVLEGSSLGALILTKHFHSKFNLRNLNGLSFFTGYEDKTLMMWKEWRALSENMAREKNLSSSAIVSQAINTFTELRNWLTGR